MWSCGVIVYILLGGYPPFHDDNHAILYRKIKAADYAFDPQYWDQVSDDAKDLIKKMLVVDPDKRSISASRGAAAPSRHRRDSCPSHHEVGGFFFEFEVVRTASSDRDAPRRLTASQALRHPWFMVGDHELIRRNLAKTLDTMKKFNARRKFKGKVKGIILANKLAKGDLF
jgi:calcium/calmodulin-dependent protein kinase I